MSPDTRPSDEWGAPHWPIIEGWRGVREYMGADIKGIWRETYVDFADIGSEFLIEPADPSRAARGVGPWLV